MLFSYFNASSQWAAQRNLSVSTIPGAILTFRDGSTIEYPQDWTFDDDQIAKFVELYLRKKLPKSEKLFSQPDQMKSIYKKMKAVKMLRFATFNATILNEGKIVMTFLFYSDDDKIDDQ